MATLYHYVMTSNLEGLPGGTSGKECTCQCRKTWVQSPGREDPLEEGVATHTSFLAWRIPCTEESGGLQPIRSQRVGRDLAHSQHPLRGQEPQWANQGPRTWDLEARPWTLNYLPRWQLRLRQDLGFFPRTGTPTISLDSSQRNVACLLLVAWISGRNKLSRTEASFNLCSHLWEEGPSFSHLPDFCFKMTEPSSASPHFFFPLIHSILLSPVR